ncbi:MAG TPA: isoprenylcysteine carboxylmethyltransferase family protein [Anaerolineales bacterium]
MSIRRSLFLIGGILASLGMVGIGLMASMRNPLGWLYVFAGLGYGLGGTLYLTFERGLGVSLAEAGDRTLWAIVPGFTAIFFGPPLEYLFLPEILPRTRVMLALGLGLCVAALLLRVWTRLELRQMYSGRLRIQQGHTLIQKGPYRFLRHPGYAGFLLLAIGLALGFSSIIGVAAIPLLMLPGLAYRIAVEEKLLEAKFGPEYRDYALRTRRLVPGIW